MKHNKKKKVGYSYGAGIACATVNDFDKIVGYVAISYPFGVYSLLYFGNGNLLNLAKSSKKQKLFISKSPLFFKKKFLFFNPHSSFFQWEQKIVLLL